MSGGNASRVFPQTRRGRVGKLRRESFRVLNVISAHKGLLFGSDIEVEF
jgi:hypothetical protein